MPTVKVRRIPEHKLDEAYDAGRAWLIDHGQLDGSRRHVPMRDSAGFPQIDDENGLPKMARYRRAPSQKWVGANGHVLHVRMTGGSSIAHDGNREQRVKGMMHNKQAIRYGVCPLRSELSIMWVPPAMRADTPCELGTHGEKKCCPHVTKIIKQRTKVHAAREKKASERYKTQQQKMNEETRDQSKEFHSSIVKLCNAVANRTVTDVPDERPEVE